jgi:hypothetical protein
VVLDIEAYAKWMAKFAEAGSAREQVLARNAGGGAADAGVAAAGRSARPSCFRPPRRRKDAKFVVTEEEIA